MTQNRPVVCETCGAPMAPSPDGRTYGCTYCGTQVQVAIDGRQIAAHLALDLANIDAFLGQLAATLQQGFAEHARIDARGASVSAIEVDLEPDRFIARREGQRVVAEHKRVVRGVALKTTTVPLDRWVQMLTDALARHANTNARAAWVLGRLTGRG